MIYNTPADVVAMSERPLGVTILGILWILFGLIWIVAAFLGGAILAMIGLGAIGAVIGVVLFIIGIIDLAIGVGCFKAWGWVWIVGVIFMAINLLIGIVSLISSPVTGLVTIIVAAIILWYLFQPKVKAYFGKA
jgi:hypothetical protein